MADPRAAPAPADGCDRCGGTGWVRSGDTPLAPVRRCDCFARDHLQQRLAAARIPPRYRDCTLESFDVSVDSPSIQAAHVVCSNYVDDFSQASYGLLFTGPPGVGKTHLAVAVLRALIERHAVRGRFADYRTLLQEIQDSYNPVSQTSELEVLRPVLEADVLLLDELGARRPTEWVRETVAHILNDRYSNNRVTLITTNYPVAPDDEGDSLADRIDPRVQSRLHEMCRKLLMDGDDYRERRSRRTVRYSGRDREEDGQD